MCSRVCEDIDSMAPPTPPNDSVVLSESLTGLFLVGADHGATELPPIVEAYEPNQDGPILAIVTSTSTSLEAGCKSLKAGSIVAVVGLRDPDTARTVIGNLGAKFPGLYFTDCHVIPSQDLSSYQVGFERILIAK